MLDFLSTSIIDSSGTSPLGVGGFILCVAAALAIGLVFALVYAHKSVCTKSFVMSLAMLPAIVCLVVMMVSGSIGAGVAVAGTFSLVRFRSAAGSAREICAVFLVMAVGIACGMGYIGYALLFTLIMSTVLLLYNRCGFGLAKNAELNKTLRITIPEDLDYGGVFDDVFEEYTSSHTLQSVKTTNMGSLFKLTYDLTLKRPGCEKAFIDALRCRNGNLEISSSIQSTVTGEL
ncbi:MAG: DUF4956 domain-containing protein [Oscillospiraceae bacterium]|nr:DUF4956 domain-containing protein [Oscillospiraceae bacterium]